MTLQTLDNTQVLCQNSGMFLAHRRVLELETAVKQLRNDMTSLASAWDSERVHLADLKEQAIRTINRLQQQKRREPQEPNGDSAPKKEPNPLAVELLRPRHVVLPG